MIPVISGWRDLLVVVVFQALQCQVLKLSDFGLAVHLPFGQKLTEKCGTPAFMCLAFVESPWAGRRHP